MVDELHTNPQDDFDLVSHDEPLQSDRFDAINDGRIAQQKRQKVFYAVVTIVIACFVIGGWLMFSGSSAPAPKPNAAPMGISKFNLPKANKGAPVNGVAIKPGDQAAVTPLPGANSPATATPSTVDPNAAQALPPTNGAAPLADVLSSPVAANNNAVIPAPTNPANIASTALPAPLPATASPDTTAPAAALTQAPIPAPVAAPVAAPAAAMPSTSTLDQPVSAALPVDNIQAKLPSSAADNEKRLTAMEDQLKEINVTLASLKGAPSVAGASTAPSSDALAALTAKIDQLTTQVTALDQRTQSLATQAQSKPAAVETPVAAAPAEDVKADAKTEAAPAPKPAVAKKKTVAAIKGWVLRSAVPDAVWLSKSGSEDITRYTVGETLPNGGTIQSVAQEDGVWIVRTTNGVIKQ